MLDRTMPQVRADQFAMVPRQDVPRSTFRTQHTVKTTFSGGYLVPFHLDEVLPGDVHKGRVTIFARLHNLLFPLMDNVTLETFFFFVPNRLVWENWTKFCGEQYGPGDSISYTVPTVGSPAGGFPILTTYDYFGVPCVGQLGGGATLAVSALPFRAYYFIMQEWFRDENIDAVLFNRATHDGDGPDTYTWWSSLYRRRKRHDYFTSCLPWPVKGGVEVPLPISGVVSVVPTTNSIGPVFKKGTGPTPTLNLQTSNAASPAGIQGAVSAAWAANDTLNWGTTNLQVDLSTAAGASLNALRLAVATQRLLEADARGGTRYTEILQNHFGVRPEDARLQRPEYCGGGVSSFKTAAIPQTSATGLTGGSTPVGALTGQSVASGDHHFSLHATEHGMLIGLVHVTADLTYQQGLHKMFTRATRYDFYWPAFAFLGEQAVLNKELYCDGSANDNLAFGYQERWAEYRHFPSKITGLFRSTSAGTIDPWHASIKFTALPVLNSSFLQDNPPLSRVLAAGGAAAGMEILFDSVFDLQRTRPLPVRSVPGLSRF